MIRSRLKCLLAFAVGALALGGMGSAYGQYVVTGTTAGGGNIVIGSGTSLGTAQSGDGNLTLNGFDNLTLTVGSQATDTLDLGATILFTTNGNIVINNGSITGNSEGESGSSFTNVGLGFYNEGSIINETVTNNGSIISSGDGSEDNYAINTGVAFLTESGSISGVTLINTGTISGGVNGAYAGSLDNGVAIIAGNGIYNISINNSGLISGGSGGGYADTIGTGIAILDYNEQSLDINGVSITNSGMILGGSNNTTTFEDESQTVMAGAGVGVAGFGNVSNISITNTSSGVILGGSFNSPEEEEGPFFGTAFAGTGIGIASLGDFGPYGLEVGPTNLTGVTILNAGIIIGSGDNGAAVDGGSGIALGASGTLSNVYIASSGSIQGGDYNYDGLSLGNGISMASGLIFTEDLNDGLAINADIDTVTIINSGFIGGGNSNFESFAAGNGISLFSGPILTGDDSTLNATINNIQIGNSGFIYGGYENGNYDEEEEEFGGGVFGNGISLFAGLSNTYEEELSSTSTISNVTIANSGLIAGGSYNGVEEGDYYGSLVFAGNGISIANFAETTSISNVAIGNSGQIYGGDYNFGGEELIPTVIPEIEEFPSIVFAGNGISIASIGLNASVSNITINNTGVIGGGSWNYDGIAMGNGISIFAGVPTEEEPVGTAGITGITINNSGSILGGQDNEGNDYESFAIGNGIGIADFADNAVISNISIYNSGTIAGGGNGNDNAWFVGTGIGILGTQINGITITNTGLIAGGSGNTYDSDFSGAGIAIVGFDFGEDSTAVLSNITINNAGTVTGGNGDPETGDGAGDAIGITGDVISGLTINNTGVITGGNTLTDVDESSGGDGIYISSGTLSNVTINNFNLIAGGNGAGGGNGIEIDAGYDPDLSINNHGVIAGGNGITSGWDGGDGIYLSIDYAANAVINNHGLIIGGNASAGGNAGIGIEAYTTGLTINNWGVIAAGVGLSQANTTNYPAVAISVNGSNNVINLNGHSAVYGTLQGVNNGGNNYLNLNFTGMSPAAIASLKQQLASQGYPNSNDFTGTFTVRGVTYYVDPLVLNLNVSSYQLQGLTPNQAAVGASLDSVTTNPALGSALGNLYNAIDNSGNVPRALEALSPQPYQIYSDIAEATANFMTLSIDERLNNLRDGSESIDTTGIGGGSDATTAAGFDKDGGKTVVQQAAPERRWGFFAQGEGLTAQVDAHGPDLLGANFTTAGLMLGLDGKVNDHLVLGLLFNYDYTSASLDPVGSNANVQTLGGGVYAGYHNGNWFGNGLAAYGHNSYDSNRDIIFPGFTGVAMGNTDGNQEIVNIDGGYDVHVNDMLTVSPLAGLQYVHLDVDSFDESGLSAANLAVGSQDVDSLRSRIGFRADFHKQIAKEVAFATEFRAAWQHEFLDHGRAIDGDFIGTGLAPFAVRTYNPGRDAALVGVGVNFTVRDRATLYFDYDVQAGQEAYLEQSVRGGLKLSF